MTMPFVLEDISAGMSSSCGKIIIDKDATWFSQITGEKTSTPG